MPKTFILIPPPDPNYSTALTNAQGIPTPGTAEYYARGFLGSPGESWGYSNTYTWSVWTYRTEGFTQFVLHHSGGTGGDSVLLFHRAQGNKMVHEISTNPGFLRKVYEYDNQPADTWSHWVAQFDRVSNLFKLFRDSVELVATTKVEDDIIPSVSDSRSNLFVGSQSTPTMGWNGFIGPIGVWNVVLTQDSIDQIYNDKFGIDLRVGVGTYNQQNSLLHHYRAFNGNIIADVDLVGGANSRDLVDSVNIRAQDIQAESP